MNYFKPELLARYRSSEDDVAEAAAQEWDEATVAYRARFKSVRAKLPNNVRRLCSKDSLHDATLLGVAISMQKPFFGMFVQLEGSSGKPGEVLELGYHTVAGPKGGMQVGTLPASLGNNRGSVHILYDEFDLDEEHAFFTHAILLSDGREIDIRFHNLSVRRIGHLFTPTELTEREVKWPLAASIA
jgi:hypothetical protein